MPTKHQYYTVKKQCESFEEFGYFTFMDIKKDFSHYGDPVIIIETALKTYKFCDPDWDVTIKQLATFYRSIKNEKNRQHDNQE